MNVSHSSIMLFWVPIFSDSFILCLITVKSRKKILTVFWKNSDWFLKKFWLFFWKNSDFNMTFDQSEFSIRIFHQNFLYFSIRILWKNSQNFFNFFLKAQFWPIWRKNSDCFLKKILTDFKKNSDWSWLQKVRSQFFFFFLYYLMQLQVWDMIITTKTQLLL